MLSLLLICSDIRICDFYGRNALTNAVRSVTLRATCAVHPWSANTFLFSTPRCGNLDAVELLLAVARENEYEEGEGVWVMREWLNEEVTKTSHPKAHTHSHIRSE